MPVAGTSPSSCPKTQAHGQVMVVHPANMCGSRLGRPAQHAKGNPHAPQETGHCHTSEVGIRPLRCRRRLLGGSAGLRDSGSAVIDISVCLGSHTGDAPGGHAGRDLGQARQGQRGRQGSPGGPERASHHRCSAGAGEADSRQAGAPSAFQVCRTRPHRPSGLGDQRPLPWEPVASAEDRCRHRMGQRERKQRDYCHPGYRGRQYPPGSVCPHRAGLERV